MPQATEIATLPLAPGVDIHTPGSDGYKTVQGMIATLVKQKGYIGMYYGCQHENPDNLELAIDWESIQNHKDFKRTDDYAPFVENIEKIMSKPATIRHAEFRKPFATVAAAPVVEMLTLYFPSDSVDEKEVEEKIGRFAQVIGETAETTVGWIEEELDHEKIEGKAKGYALSVGWQSIEAHKAFRETQVFKDNIGIVRSIAKGSTMYHVKFTKG